MTNKPNLDEPTRQLAERMLRMPPKPHDEMKVGKGKPSRGGRAATDRSKTTGKKNRVQGQEST